MQAKLSNEFGIDYIFRPDLFNLFYFEIAFHGPHCEDLIIKTFKKHNKRFVNHQDNIGERLLFSGRIFANYLIVSNQTDLTVFDLCKDVKKTTEFFVNYIIFVLNDFWSTSFKVKKTNLKDFVRKAILDCWETTGPINPVLNYG